MLVSRLVVVDGKIFTAHATVAQRRERERLLVAGSLGHEEFSPELVAVRAKADGELGEQLRRVQGAIARLEVFYAQDKAGYMASFVRTVDEILLEDGLEELPIIIGPVDARPVLSTSEQAWADVAADVIRRAVANTPLPVLGAPPTAGRSPADQLRTVGATFLARAVELR